MAPAKICGYQVGSQAVCKTVNTALARRKVVVTGRRQVYRYLVCHRISPGLPCHDFRQLPLPLWSYECSEYLTECQALADIGCDERIGEEILRSGYRAS